MFVSEGLRSLTELLKMNMILRKQMCFVPSSRQKCMAHTCFLIEPWMANHSGTCWLRGLSHNWNMTVLTLSINWMEPHATITVMLGTSLTRHCHIDGLEEQSTMINIFYSGHRGHRTWHPVIFFLWGYVKDNAYKPPLPQNVRELQDRIRAVVQTIDGNMLKRVW